MVLFKDLVYLDGNERSSIELITSSMDGSKYSLSVISTGQLKMTRD
tara:strand:+ start:216 stop:353 length:138 start_codon:yes stop_codon:yes gene_type:complete